MNSLLNFLSHPAWTGVAGLAAVISLLLQLKIKHARPKALKAGPRSAAATDKTKDFSRIYAGISIILLAIWMSPWLKLDITDLPAMVYWWRVILFHIALSLLMAWGSKIWTAYFKHDTTDSASFPRALVGIWTGGILLTPLGIIVADNKDKFIGIIIAWFFGTILGTFYVSR